MAMPWKLCFPSGVSTFLLMLFIDARIVLFFRRPGGTYTPCVLKFSHTYMDMLLQLFWTLPYATPIHALFNSVIIFWLRKL